jgi:hypothetical protein
MSITRRTALKTVERADWDGNYFDSITHARMFRSYKPYDMGVRSAELFSAKVNEQIVNKKFTYYTVAKGNTFMLPGGVDDYTWKLVSNKARTFRITKVYSTPNNQPGKGGAQFKIALDSPGLMEPVLLKTEDPDAPRLRIIGQSKQVGANQYELVVELQTSNPAEFIDPALLAMNAELVDCGTSVSDELNQKYGGDYFDDMFRLEGVVGNFARKATFTDKFIRREIACRKNGTRLSGSFNVGKESYAEGAVGHGYTYQVSLKNKNTGKMIEKGVFITNVVARLEERLMNDREMSFEFGRLQIANNYDEQTGRTRKDPAGWREIVKDGQYMQHNGSLSLGTIEDFITNIFATRKNFMDRVIKIATGEGGFKFLHRLIAAEYAQFQTIDTLFASKRSESQVHRNELEYGAQFTKIHLLNGITLELVYDPIKDDPTLFPEKAPGSMHSVESYAMDIFDFGVTDQTPQGASSMANIACVMQDGVEEFVRVQGIYDFETGAINDGSVVNSTSKECEVRRATSGALAIWDATRIGRIEYVPVDM